MVGSAEEKEPHAVYPSMKTTIQRFVLAGLMLSLGASCTTAYDAYGRPRTVVEPGAAVLGAAAAGLAGYAIASNRGDRHRNYSRHRSHGHRSYSRYDGHHHSGHHYY